MQNIYRSLLLVLAVSAMPAGLLAGDVAIRFDPAAAAGPLDGRLLLIVSRDASREPRHQVTWGLSTAQVFGADASGWTAGAPKSTRDAGFIGYPLARLDDLPPGDYQVQAVLHRYDTFVRSEGPPVKLPASWAAGQQWNREPGNLYSAPVSVRLDPAAAESVELLLDRVIPDVEEPEDTAYVKHVKIRSERLSEFWGRDMYLGAHVLLPHGFEQDASARYPLAVFHGHFPADFGGFRTEPPDPDLECEYSERFGVDCYNRIQQQEAFDFYRQWISDDFPRFLAIEIQHANPFYDDSYAVNSENLGPYGDAITWELIPEIERRFRGVGEGWGRFLYGGSTGGWESLAAQVFYPSEYNGAFAACPDPIDFRSVMTVNIYEDENAYFRSGPFLRVAREGRRNYLGHVDMTMEGFNRMELALGTRTRSGQQFDIWEAVYSPRGDDGYPRRIWDRTTGEIDREVAEAWRKYDLRHVLETRWAEIGPELVGKIHVYCGDMDNYYLNDAVYLMEDFLESTADPHYAGVVDYGDRAEHCWNGDHENPNYISRLRYHTLYLPRMRERLAVTAPADAPLRNWRD